MIVIATGPRSNGTSLLYRIITTGGGKTPLHLPAFPPEFREQDWSTDFPTALFVVIYRELHTAARSALARGFHPTLGDAIGEQEDARKYLVEQRCRHMDRWHVIRYEHLVAQPEQTIGRLNSWLCSKGYKGQPLSLPEPIVERLTGCAQ